MADAVVRLKAESQEYEQKLQRAISKLQQMEKECNKVGGTMAVAEKADVEFARSLGSMQTKATSASGKISELNKAFTETALRYKRLTDEEKNSDFGKALGKSVEELKGRLMDAKSEMKSVTDQTKEGSSVMEVLAGKIGLSVGQFTTLGGVLGTVGAALKVAKDAFMSTEAGADEWDRTIEAATSSYNAFCQSLATGSFDTLLTNLGNIISRAKETYNALDDLKTVGGIISNQEAMLNSKRAKDLMTIKNPKATAQQKSAARADLAVVQQQKGAAIDQTKLLNNNYIKNALRNQAGVLTDDEYNRYYKLIVKSLYDSAAKDVLDKTTVTRSGVQAISNGNGQYTYQKTMSQINVGDLFNDKFRESLNPYVQAYWNADTRRYTDERTDNRLMGKIGGGSSSGNTSTKSAVQEYVPVEGSIDAMIKKVQELQKQFNATADQSVRDGLKVQIEECNAQLDVMRGKTKEVKIEPVEMAVGVSGMNADAFSEYGNMLKDGLKKADIGSALYESLSENLADTSTLENVLTFAFQNGIDLAAAGIDAEGMWDKIISGENIEDADWQSVADAINAKLQELGIEPIEIEFNTGSIKKVSKDIKGMGQDFQYAMSAVSNLGSAMKQLDTPALNIAGVIAQAIADIALSFGDALAKDQTTKSNIWAFIAAAAASTVEMVSVIATIKSATAYANGGIVHAAGGAWVPGNNTSGDMVPAMLNSGELVLNKAQQGNLASQLSDTGSNFGGNVEFHIEGRTLVGVLRKENTLTSRM